MTTDLVKKLKQEVMELSIELAKQQDEINEYKIYKQRYLTSIGKICVLNGKIDVAIKMLSDISYRHEERCNNAIELLSK